MKSGGKGRWGRVESSVVIISNAERGLAWPILPLFTTGSAPARTTGDGERRREGETRRGWEKGTEMRKEWGDRKV